MRILISIAILPLECRKVETDIQSFFCIIHTTTRNLIAGKGVWDLDPVRNVGRRSTSASTYNLKGRVWRNTTVYNVIPWSGVVII